MTEPYPSLLYVDIDGTLVQTDTLWESIVSLVKHRPEKIPLLPLWLFQGKATFKELLSAHASLDVSLLPYRQEVVEFLRDAKQRGVAVILATAANHTIARNIAAHLNLSQEVLASDSTTNLSGIAKRDAILQHAAGASFAYIGNSPVDRSVWAKASIGHVVAPSGKAQSLVAGTTKIGTVFTQPPVHFINLAHALRIHQWPKNLLILLPLFLSHQFTDIPLFVQGLLGFIAFSFVASCMYICNDLFDLESDRNHPEKRLRPFASGILSIPSGLLLATASLILGVLIGFLAGGGSFLLVILLYAAASGAYSWGVKRLFIIDILMLASLYVYRIYAGSILLDIAVSHWLAAFAFFFFLGLATIKRAVEIADRGEQKGRAYRVRNLLALQILGVGSTLLSLIIFIFYLQSTDVVALYRSPWMLWGIWIVLAYWSARLWFLSYRGRIHDDPVTYALTDPISYMCGFTFVCVFVLASFI